MHNILNQCHTEPHEVVTYNLCFFFTIPTKFFFQSQLSVSKVSIFRLILSTHLAYCQTRQHKTLGSHIHSKMYATSCVDMRANAFTGATGFDTHSFDPLVLKCFTKVKSNVWEVEVTSLPLTAET